jgi:hypothetical protein
VTQAPEAPTILRCVDPVCGLVQHRLYRLTRFKDHPITGQRLWVVREWPKLALPVEGEHDFGYLPGRFERMPG